MIAVDTSALVAIALKEAEHLDYLTLLAEQRGVIGAPSVVETKLVFSRVPAVEVDAFLRGLMQRVNLSVVPFSPEMAEIAVAAFRRYGKGQGHPAQLNFGDCMSYAVAKVHDVPLLFKGHDFSATDLRPAQRP